MSDPTLSDNDFKNQLGSGLPLKALKATISPYHFQKWFRKQFQAPQSAWGYFKETVKLRIKQFAYNIYGICRSPSNGIRQ